VAVHVTDLTVMFGRSSFCVTTVEVTSQASTLHYIGVLTPLTDTGHVCGRTEVKLGSHNAIGADQSATLQDKKLSLRVGDALVLDGRTLHRGLASDNLCLGRRRRELWFRCREMQPFQPTELYNDT
jgi:hypothetical protein